MKYNKIISKVLIVGLCIGNLSINSFANEINTKQSKSSEVGTWESGIYIFPPRRDFSTEVVDGKIYIIGGVINPSGVEEELSNSVDVYDPSTNELDETKTPMPTARSSFETIAINKKIYCIGGELEDGTLTNVVEVYDTVNDSWDTTKAPMPMANSGFSTVLLEGKIYILGGTANDGFSPMYSTSIYEYDIANNKWASTGVIYAEGRAHFTAQVLGRRIYYMGGHDGFGNYSNGNFAYDFNIVNPPRHIFLEDMPTARGHLESVLIDDKIYCIGGKNNDGVTNVVEVYDITNNTWDTSITPMPTGRYGFCAEYVDGKIYCIGGYNSSGNMGASVNVYTLPTSEPDSIEPEAATNNIDLYIKMANTLSLSLNTTNIAFDDFTGVEDMEKKNAVNLTVESSLPYEINVSLEDEIKSTSGTEVVDKSVLSIKANTENSYNTFTAVNTPITLLNSQEYGDINNHAIDLKLNKNIISKADVYKATIRLEVKQK